MRDFTFLCKYALNNYHNRRLTVNFWGRPCVKVRGSLYMAMMYGELLLGSSLRPVSVGFVVLIMMKS